MNTFVCHIIDNIIHVMAVSYRQTLSQFIPFIGGEASVRAQLQLQWKLREWEIIEFKSNVDRLESMVSTRICSTRHVDPINTLLPACIIEQTHTPMQYTNTFIWMDVGRSGATCRI